MTPINLLLADQHIKSTLDYFDTINDKLIAKTIDIQQIPAPTFAEGQRAAYIAEQLQATGLLDVEQDAIHNVFGRIAGSNSQLKPLIISAHSDTVFPLETDLTVSYDNDKIYGPGIADNSAGVAGLLMLAETMIKFGIQAVRDIWFVANVGEEGLGDLNGMRAVTERFADAHGFVVVEGGMFGYLLHEAIGVRRYKVAVTADGGHSWTDFGRTSAIHVLGQTIAQIDNIRLPKTPKTTYNIGTIEGGTTVNTVAASASFLLDLRSEEPQNLQNLVTQFEAIIEKMTRQYPEAAIAVSPIGNRPAGGIPRTNALVTAAHSALQAVGCQKIHYLRGSTDANIPLSKNLPTVCLGLTKSANAHRLDEYLDINDFPRGMKQLLLVVLSASEYAVAD